MSEKKSNKAHIAGTVAGILISLLLIPIILINIMILFKDQVYNENPPSVAGISGFVVRENNEAGLNIGSVKKGDFGIGQRVDTTQLEINEVVIYKKDGRAQIGKIKDVLQEEEQTYLIQNMEETGEKTDAVTADDVAGRYLLSIPHAGQVVVFMSSGFGALCCIGIPVLFMLCFWLLQRRKYAGKEPEAEEPAPLNETPEAERSSETLPTLPLLSEEEQRQLEENVAVLTGQAGEETKTEEKSHSVKVNSLHRVKKKDVLASGQTVITAKEGNHEEK